VAGSVALVGFGFDSWIEVAAAAVVLHRLRAEIRHGEVDEAKQRRTLRFIAITFFALAAHVTVEGIRDLVTDSRPDTSIVGIVLTAVSIVVGWTWIDPVAGFVIAAFAILEGKEAWEGELVEHPTMTTN
jgi:hypothetical protein